MQEKILSWLYGTDIGYSDFLGRPGSSGPRFVPVIQEFGDAFYRIVWLLFSGVKSCHKDRHDHTLHDM